MPPGLPGRVHARSWLLLSLALALAAPVLVVAGSWLAGASPNWAHLRATVLPDYARLSLLLAAGTGLGTLVIGVGASAMWAAKLEMGPVPTLSLSASSRASS